MKRFSFFTIFLFNIFYNVALLEEPVNWQVGFQTPASPVMEGIVKFHHDLFYIIVLILSFTFFMLIRCLMRFGFTNPLKEKEESKTRQITTFHHAPVLEIIWTIIPALILIVISIPSYSLIYSMDDLVNPLLTIRVIGHQWYWSYEEMDMENFLDDIGEYAAGIHKFTPAGQAPVFNEYHNTPAFLGFLTNKTEPKILSYDSYMLPVEDIEEEWQRLIAVDNELILPIETNVRILVTSADVIHSWAVPALGIKLDGCPGRLNQTTTYITRPSTFYGQCSEICGVNHGFMPIVVQGVDSAGEGTNLGEYRTPMVEELLAYFEREKFL